MKSNHQILKIHSNGIGTQSMAMYFMSCLGIIPRFDYSIFADTGSEGKSTYKYLHWLQQWIEDNPDIAIPLIWTGKKSIYKDLLYGRNSTGQSFASIPAYTKNEDGIIGQLKRQCTDEYKIVEVNKAIRKLYGLKPKQWLPKTEIYIGITIEELSRVSIPDSKNKEHIYPFCNYRSLNGQKSHFLDYDSIFGSRLMSKSDCINWLMKNDFLVPSDSACTICPYRKNDKWQDMKENRPSEFKRAVKLDYGIRNSTKKGVDQPIYLHKSCKPLDQVNFTKDQETINFECSGTCHV